MNDTILILFIALGGLAMGWLMFIILEGIKRKIYKAKD